MKNPLHHVAHTGVPIVALYTGKFLFSWVLRSIVRAYREIRFGKPEVPSFSKSYIYIYIYTTFLTVLTKIFAFLFYSVTPLCVFSLYDKQRNTILWYHITQCLTCFVSHEPSSGTSFYNNLKALVHLGMQWPCQCELTEFGYLLK